MKKYILHVIITSAVMLNLIACGKMQEGAGEHGEHDEHEAAHGEHGHEGKLAIITQAQFKAIDIQLAVPEKRNLKGILQTTGYLKVPPQNKANVSAMTGGIVQQIFVKEGDYVRSGKVVATIVNREFISMQEQYLTTSSELVLAEQELARQKELSANQVSAQKNLQQAEANYSVLKARLSSLEQQLNVLGISAKDLDPGHLTAVISVTSPVNGYVSHIDVNIGSYVEASKEIMDVVDNSQLHLDLFVFEQDMQKVKIDQEVTFTLTNLPGKTYNAKIFAIGSAFEKETKSIPLHAVITGDKTGLIEGMNVSANIEIENIRTTAVPSGAIVSEEGRDYVFIWALDHQAEVNSGHTHDHEEAEHTHEEAEHTHEETENELHTGEMKPDDKYVFEKMPVKKGITESGYTEITMLGDYVEGEQVVVNGAFYLLGSLSNEGEAHEH